MKKIKEKYKDQDEEDRELMMQLLGVRMNKNNHATLNTKLLLLFSDIAMTPSAVDLVLLQFRPTESLILSP